MTEEFEIDDDVNPDPIDPLPLPTWPVTADEISIYQRRLAVAEAATAAAQRTVVEAQAVLHEAVQAAGVAYRELREKMKLQRVQMVPESGEQP